MTFETIRELALAGKLKCPKCHAVQEARIVNERYPSCEICGQDILDDYQLSIAAEVEAEFKAALPYFDSAADMPSYREWIEGTVKP